MKRLTAISRFAAKTIEPDRSAGLSPRHPALIEGRTIFPSSVVGTWDSPRFLVSGHNNPKLGKTVLKGPRTGWPIFHLTLEERATCPRSCQVWADCYGNAMPYSRRHRPDEDFIGVLGAEVITLARQHPEGLLIRLHALGDFYSVAYVRMWERLLAALDQVHVFGYTARSQDDAEGPEIYQAIKRLTDSQWERFAIRFSRSAPGPQTSIVVGSDPHLENVIVCPAQTGATTACATCGLCWAPAAKDKAIAFLRHGMKSGKGIGRKPHKSLEPSVKIAAPPIADDRLSRLAAISETERQRIASTYGARW